MSSIAFFLILTTITFAGHVHSIHTPTNPVAVGSNVTIFSDTNVTLGVWLFNNDILVYVYPGGKAIDDAYKDRVIYDSAMSALTIISATLNYSGEYILKQINKVPVRMTISILEPIQNVTLSAQRINLVEFNDTAVLTCSVSSGSPLAYIWLDGDSSIVDGENAQLSNKNATLTISMVKRSNQGPYRCNVSNEIGYEVSNPLQLNISYGPENSRMTVMPVRSIYKTGSNISLLCSTESSPSAMIQWMFNDEYLNQYGPQLNLENINESHSGNYTCIFYNAVTLRYSSASSMIQIFAVAVKQTDDPIILHEPFSLTCDVTGPVDSILWWKDGQLISADNTTIFDMNNKTLTLNPAQLSDNGEYMCQAFNFVSNMTSRSYTVKVSYGPDMLTIMGPKVVKAGNNATLSCQGESVPASLYQWYFKGSLVSNMSEYIIPQLTMDMSGNYICMAFNNLINKSSTASIMLTVVDPIEIVQIEAQMNYSIGGGSYLLTCSVTGPVDLIYWMKNDEPLHADNRTVFSMNNKTVMLMQMDHSDAGNYKCVAINAVENVTSTPYNLFVNFGPVAPIIYGPAYGETGSQVVFSCDAMSVHPNSFSWWFNGSMINNTSLFIAGPLSLNMSGKYTCMAHNHVTGKNSTNSTMLTVIEAINSVMINNNTMPISNKNLTLMCNILGPYDTIYWKKDGMHLSKNASSTNSSTYHIENNMIHFTPVTVENNGTYQCIAINKAAHHKSPEYMLRVNYGPLNVYISGPTSNKAATSGSGSMSLTCSADSYPDCVFRWFLDKKLVGNGSVYTFSAGKQSEGNYTCEATNHVTSNTMTQYKMYSVAGHASATLFVSKGGLMFVGLCALSAHLLFL